MPQWKKGVTLDWFPSCPCRWQTSKRLADRSAWRGESASGSEGVYRVGFYGLFDARRRHFWGKSICGSLKQHRNEDFFFKKKLVQFDRRRPRQQLWAVDFNGQPCTLCPPKTNKYTSIPYKTYVVILSELRVYATFSCLPTTAYIQSGLFEVYNVLAHQDQPENVNFVLFGRKVNLWRSCSSKIKIFFIAVTCDFELGDRSTFDFRTYFVSTPIERKSMFSQNWGFLSIVLYFSFNAGKSQCSRWWSYKGHFGAQDFDLYTCLTDIFIGRQSIDRLVVCCLFCPVQ